ncbi:MAG: bifunctional folylpolyglutamate synthase/dihydrofolate synthase [Flavobacteriaceae bacterium]|nr:bifunctional folylpolyglutamate synthase/dihydrofolate synthase [Flavobacteriaceae bacterium]
MTYSETINWLFSQLPMYQRIGQAAYKADLSNTLNLAEYLDHPETSFKSVHLAGTNGKGSTSHMLASVLQEAGYKVGLYTSPHLKDFRERIKINGNMISEGAVVDFIDEHRRFFETNQLSFFEMTVGMAFDHFRKEEVDIAVVEVGLGGRLDSTNIIIPEVSVITNIGMDHTQFLGNDLPTIAGEKAGIIKEGVPVVIGEKQAEPVEVFERIAHEKNSELIFAEQVIDQIYPTDLHGGYQHKNQRTALATLEVLRRKGWSMLDENIIQGLQNVIKNTGLSGRWQVIMQHPKVICDTAHNKEGLSLVLAQLISERFRDLHVVLGVVNDKKLDEILPLFPKHACYYFCAPAIPRAMDAGKLSEQAGRFGLLGAFYESVRDAYEEAIKNADKDDIIFVGGSTFVVAEVL